MTRKITVNMYMTLDGYGEFPKYPGSNVPPKEPVKGSGTCGINRYDSVDTILYGRRSYEGHLAVQSESARKPSDPEYLFEFSRFLDRSKKIVFSHYLKKAEWQNTRIMKGDLARIVTRLRQEPEKYVIVDAGPSLVQEFIQRGLADDYCIFVMPIIFGRGKKLYWGPMLKQAESDASVGQESQPWRAGVALRDGSIGKAVLVRELSMILTPHPERYSS